MSKPNNEFVNAPATSHDRFDNPLLPHQGVPVTQDDFVDSTERVINATGANVIRDPLNKNVWNVDPSLFYVDSGLGIDYGNPNKFNLGRFNKEFDRNKEIAAKNQDIKDAVKLSELSREDKKVSLYDLSIYQILINTKNAWFNFLDDILDRRFQLDTLTKENRLFYIGLTLLVIAIILYIYFMIVDDKSNEKNNKIYYAHRPMSRYHDDIPKINVHQTFYGIKPYI